jgi:hypothetical protein
MSNFKVQTHQITTSFIFQKYEYEPVYAPNVVEYLKDAFKMLETLVTYRIVQRCNQGYPTFNHTTLKEVPYKQHGRKGNKQMQPTMFCHNKICNEHIINNATFL